MPDLRETELGRITQEHYGTKPRRQPANGLLQACLQIAPLHYFLWERVGVRHGRQRRSFVISSDRLQFREGDGSFAPQFIHTAIECDLEEPGLERVSCPQVWQRKIQLEQDLLQDITGQIIVTSIPAEKGEEGWTIAPHECFKSVLI